MDSDRTGRGELDPETLAFAHRMFDLAREGDAAELAAHVDAGLPVDLTVDAGAEPAAGSHSALATAAVFELPDMAELLRGRERG